MDVTDWLDHLRLGAEIAGLDLPALRLPDERDVLANGLRIHVLEWGPADGPPVVFLHGGSLTAHTWDLVCLALSDRYRCVAVDLRGHGESEWPADADYRLEAFAADVGAVIDTLGLDRPVVVGMSLGGLTSMRLAGERSDRLRGLVVVDVGPDLRTDGAQEIVEFTKRDQEMDSVEDFVARVLRDTSTRKPELLRRSIRHNLRQLPNGRWTWKWDKRRMSEPDFEAMRADHARIWDSVAAVTCPALVVRGERSRVFLDEDGRKLTGALRDGRYEVIAGAGHTIQGEKPRELLAVLIPFFDRCFGASS